MPNPRSVFNCTECDAQWPRWLGRCPDCGGWDTLVEERRFGQSPSGGSIDTGRVGFPGAEVAGQDGKPQALGEIELDSTPRLATGIAELDRVLGGGLVRGSTVLLGGEPGIGKSTLALQAAAAVQRGGGRVLYVSGEESLEQIWLGADRIA
jgi:DNA repair protein RadA/Sms